MDAFAVLGIDRDADTRQIRLAYRREARAHHPDVGGDTDSFVRLHEAYRFARSSRAAMKAKQASPRRPKDKGQPRYKGQNYRQASEAFESESVRYDLADIAYRFELGRPGHNAASFIAAVDAELFPGAETLNLGPDALELISYLIKREVGVPLVVSAIVREIDNGRKRDPGHAA